MCLNQHWCTQRTSGHSKKVSINSGSAAPGMTPEKISGAFRANYETFFPNIAPENISGVFRAIFVNLIPKIARNISEISVTEVSVVRETTRWSVRWGDFALQVDFAPPLPYRSQVQFVRWSRGVSSRFYSCVSRHYVRFHFVYFYVIFVRFYTSYKLRLAEWLYPLWLWCKVTPLIFFWEMTFRNPLISL